MKRALTIAALLALLLLGRPAAPVLAQPATPTATATATATPTATPTATAYPAPATNLDESDILTVTQQLAGDLTNLADTPSTPTFNVIGLFGGMVIGFWIFGMFIRRLVSWRND
jgi:hypothetical protein